MDFATVREKLASGAYANLEQFEVRTMSLLLFSVSFKSFVSLSCSDELYKIVFYHDNRIAAW